MKNYNTILMEKLQKCQNHRQKIDQNYHTGKEIRQVVYSLYWAKEITGKVYNTIIK